MSETARRRVRHNQCCVASCDNHVWRGERWGVCTDHQIRIWRLIEREIKLLGSEPLPKSPWPLPDDTDIIAGPDTERAVERAAKIKQLPSHMQDGTLYALDTGVGDGVKIGWTSRDVCRRLAEYPPTFRTIITAPGTRADERDIHRSLKLFRMEGMGKEWYHANNGEVVRAINDLIARANIQRQQNLGRQVERDVELDRDGYIYKNIMRRRFESLDEWRDQLPTPPVAPMPGPKTKTWVRHV